MSSRFIQAVASVRIPLLLKAEWYFIVCICHTLFIHPFISWGTLVTSTFRLWWIMLLWHGVQIMVYTPVLFSAFNVFGYTVLRKHHIAFHSGGITLHFHLNVILKYFVMHSSTVMTKAMFWNQKKRIIFYVSLTFRNCLHNPGWCGSVDWVQACESKGHPFDSRSGHMPGLWARFPVVGAWEATTHWCFSPSPPPFPSLKVNK